MALIDPDQVITLEVPGEPDQWVRFRPLTAGDVEELMEENGNLRPAAMIAKSIIAWSYGPDVSIKAVRSLELETYNWLSPLVTKASGIRDAEEKKDSAPESSPTSGPEPEGSPENSGT